MCKSLQYWYCNICNTKVALKTSSFPLACVCGPVTISWSQSVQVSHYPRILTNPFMSIYCCWGVRWRAKGHLCMKYSLGISNLLEKISSLSHSVVFLYLFALITEEGFLISPCYSLYLCILILKKPLVGESIMY